MITCEEPEVPSGSYVVGYDLNVHSTIEYHCDDGHVLRGEATRICTQEGVWSGATPTCECKYMVKKNSLIEIETGFALL